MCRCAQRESAQFVGTYPRGRPIGQAQGHTPTRMIEKIAQRHLLGDTWDMESLPSLSPSNLGFVRAAVISPELRVADVAFNTQAIIAALREAAGQGCRVAVFPELCLPATRAPICSTSARCWTAAAAALDEIALRGAEGRDRRRRRAAAGGRRQAVQLRGVHRRRAGAGPRPQNLPAFHQRVLRGALVHVGQPGDPADGRDQRAGGAVRLRSAFCRRQSVRLRDRDRSVRGSVGGESAQRRHGVGRRDDPAQRLGQQRAVGEGRLPS